MQGIEECRISGRRGEKARDQNEIICGAPSHGAEVIQVNVFRRTDRKETGIYVQTAWTEKMIVNKETSNKPYNL